jgi:hypothetical protein
VEEYTTAVFHETLRLFPPVARMGKSVLIDTVLKARRFAPPSGGRGREVEEFSVHIPTGSLVMIDVFAVHMNRRNLSRLSSSVTTYCFLAFAVIARSNPLGRRCR